VPGDDADFDHFYEAFESAFRGDPALIRQRQEAYLPLLRAALPPGAATLDLGCGRGEWLELVQENGWQADGWDLNGRFIDTCRAKGLRAHHGDALAEVARIAAQAPGSLHAITAFHLVEHIPFQAMLTLVDNALLALADGGLLIFETPNPENLSVGANTFYTDPTHQRPLHPATMAFMAQRSGFTQAVSWRLTTARGITPLPVPAEGGLLADIAQQLNRHLAAGPDFALVARKGRLLPDNVQPQ
jgi:SAM-dependent methyltransferase